MNWWVYVLVGSGLLIFVVGLYANRDHPNVSFEGGSPKVVTTVLVLVSLALIIIGVWGYFNPGVLVWLTRYAETSEKASNAWEVLGFLFWNIVIVGAFVYILLFRHDEADVLPGLLIIMSIFAIYWVWVILTGRFDAWILEPFRYLHDLVFH